MSQVRPTPTPAPLPPGAEPTEVIRARVHSRLLLLLLAMIALPVSYLIGTYMARRNLRVEDCLPPGITLQSPLAGDDAGVTVGEKLQALGATVQNGVLIDSEGVPIAFAAEGSEAAQPAAPGSPKMGMQNRFRIITIPQFDFARAAPAR